MSLEIDYDKNRWIITGGIRDAERMALVPNTMAVRKSEPGVAKWRAPASLSVAKQLHNTFGELEWTEDAKEHRADLSKVRKERLNAKEGKTSQLFYDDRLSPLQNHGVDWLMCGSGQLSDDQGSGKTVMLCLAAHHLPSSDVLVVTTKSTLGSWMDHMEEWTDITPFLFHGTKKEQETALAEYEAFDGRRALITTHALAGNNSRLASYGAIAASGEDGPLNRQFDIGIVDEIHKMGKDPKNKWVRALWAIGSNCTVRWGATGTPVNDNPEDLWVLMHFIEPTLFGRSRNGYRGRYCIMRDNGFRLENMGLHPDAEEEFQWVLAPYFLRRLKQEVVVGLPEQLPTQYIRLPLTPAQKKAYGQLTRDMMAEVGDGILITPDSLGKLQGLEYIADGLPVVDDDGSVSSLDTRLSTSNKGQYLVDVAEQRNGDPFVVYAFSSKTVDALATMLEEKEYRVAKITGAVDQEQRDIYIDMFQDGKLDVLFITDAGAEGITLTAADLVIFARESWRAVTNQQVADRINRWGQTRRPQVQVLLSEGTIDMSRRKAVVNKQDMQEQVLRDKKRIKAFAQGELDPAEEF